MEPRSICTVLTHTTIFPVFRPTVDLPVCLPAIVEEEVFLEAGVRIGMEDGAEIMFY